MEKSLESQISYESYCENYRRRSKLRKLNFDAQSQQLNNNVKRNSQIKMIQKFIAKFKTQNKNEEMILNEIDSVNLSKYLEQISNIIAASITQKQINFYTQIATKINTQYQNFPSLLKQDLLKTFNNLYQSNQDTQNKLKSLLLFITQLFLCGFTFSYKNITDLLKKIFQSGTKKKTNFPTQNDKKLFVYYYNSQSYAAFLQNYGEMFTKCVPKWVNNWIKQQKQINKLSEIVPVQAREQLTSFFLKYIVECSSTLKQTFKCIKQSQASLIQNLKFEGQFNKQNEKKYSDLIQKYSMTIKNLYMIAQAVNQNIQKYELSTKILDTNDILNIYLSKDSNAQIFQNQYEKQLYEKLLEFPLTEEKVTVATDEQYKALKEKLDVCKNLNDADEIVNMFAKINNKKNRKALGKDALEYRKEYSLVTPYLCRIIATIYQSYKDMSEFVTDFLISQFQKLKEQSSINFVVNDKKNRNLKYICELTKFKMIEPQKTIACIRFLVEDLKGYNIQLLINSLESVGRFLYLSKQSTSKFISVLNLFENVIKKKSFPVFTMSQLINSINLVKPYYQHVNTEVIEKSALQIKAEQILSANIQDDVEPIIQEINKFIQLEGGLQAIQRQLFQKIQAYYYLTSYNYAFLLENLNNPEIIQYIVNRTIQKLNQQLSTGINQLSLFWSRFLGQLYNYKLLKRKRLFETIENLFTIKNQLGVINSVCTILETSRQYLINKKININNQKFMLMVEFKKFIHSCSYIPMLEQFTITEIFWQLQPNLIELKIEQVNMFLNHLNKKFKQTNKEINYSQQLERWGQMHQFIKEKPKVEQKQMVDTRGQEIQSEKQDKSSPVTQTSILQLKAFDQQYTNIIDSNIREYSSRLAKPILVEHALEKKKQKKTKVQNKKVITIIGRSGNKMIKKDICYKDIEKTQ